MTNPLKLLALLAGLICIFSPRAMAQDSNEVEISFRVLCFEYRDNVTSVFAPASGSAGIEVPLYTDDFTDVIKAKFGGGKASFFIEEPGPGGKMQRKIVAEGTLAKSVQQAFLLVPNDVKSGGPVYRILAFEDGEETFPMGSIRAINFAQFPIRLNLAGAEMPPIKPGGVGVYPMVKKIDEWNMFTAKIQFGVSEGKWLNAATQSWKASNGKRDWVICRYNPATKQPLIRQYQDIPPWRKPVLPVTDGKPR